MLARSASLLAARGARVGARRGMSAYANKLGEWETTAAALLQIPNFPEQLKPWMESVSEKKKEFGEFEAKYPEMVKTIESKVAEIKKAGIPEDPRLAGMSKDSVKYELLKLTYEGDYIRDALKDAGLNVYTLTDADKAEIKADMAAAAKEKGIDASLVGKSIPDKLELF